MFSVVRITTGITSNAKATDPAQPEKPPNGTTSMTDTNMPITMEGADSKMSFTKRVTWPSQPCLLYSAR